MSEIVQNSRCVNILTNLGNGGTLSLDDLVDPWTALAALAVKNLFRRPFFELSKHM